MSEKRQKNIHGKRCHKKIYIGCRIRKTPENWVLCSCDLQDMVLSPNIRTLEGTNSRENGVFVLTF